MNILPDIFSIKTAWRDARSQLGSLALYCGGIVAGVAALIAILSFRSDVMLTVNDQAKELLGADLEISHTEPYNDELTALIDSIGGGQSRSIEFSSMVLYRASSGSARTEANATTRDAAYPAGRDAARLSQIRAIEGGFPFYGEIKTEPPQAAMRYQQDRTALVDRPIMLQLGLQAGDSIRVGDQWLQISGMILEVPGESAAFSLIGPRVIIPRDVVEGTSLLERGSRVQYKTWFHFESNGRTPMRSHSAESRNMDDADIAALASRIRETTPDRRVSVTTVASRKEDFAQIVDLLTKFLGMVGFIALMLGALGVASAVYVYIKRKSAAVATLRCLGASSRQTVHIFGLQVIGLGFIGALAGALLGLVVQRFLPLLFTDFLPFDLVQQISVPALLLGFSTGVLVSFTLALMPLISINNIPPLLTIRSTDFSPLAHVSKRIKAGVSIGVVVLLTLVLALLLENILAAMVFTAGIIVSMVILFGVSLLMVRLAKAMRLKSLSYIWRQGIANMFRPNNQTAVLVTVLGMGMLLIGSMYLSQEMILQRIDFQTGDNQPNLVFYDIQTDQVDGIEAIVNQNGTQLIENVPIVSMRLSRVNGRSIRDIRRDTVRTASSWALAREYRVTYREFLNESETIREGEWTGRSEGIGSGVIVPVSLDYRLADDLDVALGDTLTFDVQGVPVDTRIASIREVDFQRPQPNFFLLFPAGVLEPAPKFHAMTLRVPDSETAAQLQFEVVQAFPNVSAIDIGLVLESVQSFLDKVAMAVQFMALFSILTGLIVLSSAIAISRFQRIRESVLLRTLGASRMQISGIQLVEYLWLGALACFTGLLLALAAGWLLAWHFFDLVFVPQLGALVVASFIVISLTLATGLLNFRGVMKFKPLEILRSEG